MRDFKDLLIWQKSVEVFKMVASDVEKFPKNRIAYNISDQSVQ